MDFSGEIQDLNEAFDMDEFKTEIKTIQERLEEAEVLTDSEAILKMNIMRADRLLDLAQQEIESGNMSSSILEACKGLIGEITSAANSLTAASFKSQDMDMKAKTLNLKELEHELKVDKHKASIDGGKQGELPEGATTVNNTTNNVFVGSREELLALMERQEDEEAIDV